MTDLDGKCPSRTGTMEVGRRLRAAWLKKRTAVLLPSLAFCLLGLATQAQAVTHNFTWVGLNGYYMTGSFSYDDSLIGTGVIDQSDIDTLQITGYRYGNPIGSWSLASGQGAGASTFMLHFDTNTNEFLQCNASGCAQFWNEGGNPGLGFFNGDTYQGLTLNGISLTDSYLDKGDYSPTLYLGGLPSTSAFDLSWTGANGYSMTGTFSYWDILDDGLIEGQDLYSLKIEGFLNGVSIGAWDIRDGQGAGASSFFFNFDTTINQLLQCGASGCAQAWNYGGNPGLGFLNGDSYQSLSLNGAIITSSQTTERSLSATPTAGGETPPPKATSIPAIGIWGLLLLTGLLGLFGVRVLGTRT